MMSQIGSDGVAEGLWRSATMFAGAIILALAFMSAMLTYFDFMLQKPGYRRKDRTGPAPFIPGVAARRKMLEWARKMLHDQPLRVDGGDDGGAVLRPARRGDLV